MSRTSKRVAGTAVVVSLAAVATLGFASAPVNARVVSALVMPTPVVPAMSAPAQIQLDMVTLHAAALSTARGAGNSSDAPYLLVTIFGPGSMQTSTQMPAANQHWTMRRDEAKGPAPVASLIIAPGDSVRVLFTLLEGEGARASQETAVANGLSKLGAPSVPTAAMIASALVPLTRLGTHWIGSATLLLTNEGGRTYWRALNCVSTCTVSKTPVNAANESELTLNAPSALAGVLELNGDAATYHLQVTARRSQ